MRSMLQRVSGAARRRGLALIGALAVSVAMVATATPAGAAIGCSGGDGCSHQTTIYMDGGNYTPFHEWWGPFTVLKMQGDGNLVLYCTGNGQAVWDTGTVNSYTTWVNFEGGSGGGSMVIWTNQGPAGNVALWSSLTKPPTHSTRGTEAIVQADGNFVIYDGSGNALWASNTYHACPGTGGYWG